MSLTLVIGGTRSGKSARAEELARASGRPVRYVATADAGDPAMADRVREHRARRPAEWTTVEAGPALGEGVAGGNGDCVLVDGLGVWIAGRMHEAGALAEDSNGSRLREVSESVLAEVGRLVWRASEPGGAPLIVVAEDAGQGVLPADAGSRAWVDLVGKSVQRLSAAAERVELVVAGRVLLLDDAGPGTLTDWWSYGDHEAVRVGVEGLRHHGDADVRPGDADHAVNVMAGGPPAWLRDVLHNAVDAGAPAYPDESDALKALAPLHGREPGEVVPTNGAAEALWLLGPALRPRLAACVHPGFTEAEAALRTYGIPVARVLREPQAGFALDPRAVPEEADLVVVGNPASPTGTLDPAAALLALRRPGRVLVVDEAFMDLVPGEPGSLSRESLPDVIVVRSLTKSLGIPGLRAGYALAPPPLAQRLRAVRPPWSANALALAALAEAGRRPGALAAAAERAQWQREDLERRLSALAGVRVWAGAANFCLVEVDDGPAAVTALRDRAIAIRLAASFPGLTENHLRITAREPAENKRLAAALAEVIGG